MSTDNRSFSQLAKQALEIQNACNLSGLIHAWSDTISRLRELLAEHGVTDTEIINQHPINVLWVNKLTDLIRADDDKFTRAYEWAKLYQTQEIEREKQD